MSVLEYNCKTKKTEYRELTNEEKSEIEMLMNIEETTTLPPTDLERLEALEKALLELAEVISNG